MTFCCATFTIFHSLAIAAAPPGIPTSQPSTCPTVDEELVKRLLGGQSSAVDTVEATLSNMQRAADRLNDKLDPGKETQAIQKEVLANIDKLVAQAQGNKAVSKNSSQVRRRGDRAVPPRRDRRASSESKSAAAHSAAKKETGAPSGASATQNRRRTDKAELSRGWGYLPPKDREEIAQGFDDEFLTKYREQIARYYRDLADKAEKSR